MQVRFVIAGWGDLAPEMVEEVASRGMAKQVFFTGFLSGGEVDRAFRSASVYVMPSVSEPFGLTALEALRNGAAMILSKSSGVAEVLEERVMMADCGDVEAMAEHILGLLRRPDRAAALKRADPARVAALMWDDPAERCLALYRQMMSDRALNETIASGLSAVSVIRLADQAGNGWNG